MMGLQIATGEARYSDDKGRDMKLEITDMGSAQGVMLMAGWASIESEKQTETGYEKTAKVDGRIVHEEWDTARKSGGKNWSNSRSAGRNPLRSARAICRGVG